MQSERQKGIGSSIVAIISSICVVIVALGAWGDLITHPEIVVTVLVIVSALGIPSWWRTRQYGHSHLVMSIAPVENFDTTSHPSSRFPTIALYSDGETLFIQSGTNGASLIKGRLSSSALTQACGLIGVSDQRLSQIRSNRSQPGYARTIDDGWLYEHLDGTALDFGSLRDDLLALRHRADSFVSRAPYKTHRYMARLIKCSDDRPHSTIVAKWWWKDLSPADFGHKLPKCSGVRCGIVTTIDESGTIANGVKRFFETGQIQYMDAGPHGWYRIEGRPMLPHEYCAAGLPPSK